MKSFGLLFFMLLVSGFSAEKPNILLILSDDQAWTDYSFMGHEHIKTPHLDKLASESALFKRGYVPTALCRPSLMTLATGQYVHNHRVSGNNPHGDSKDPNKENWKANVIANIDRFDTLPELLGEQGYLSHQSGKWWEGSYKRGGFTHGMTKGYPNKGGRHGDVGLKIGREGIQPVEDFVDHSIAEDKPFFLWYAPFMPHTPHTPPERILKKYKALGLNDYYAKYYSMCEWFDETCGQMVEMLEKRNIRDNTLIVYVCDNGWIQQKKSKGYEMRSKRSAYEGGTRTPIFYSWPAKIKSADRPELATSLDVFPTILAASGARMPKDLPGLNLLENLSNNSKIDREEIYGESFLHDIIDVSVPEKSLVNRWIIKGEWKLLLTYTGNKLTKEDKKLNPVLEPQLFNLKEDPMETKNLAKEKPELFKELVGKIEAWYPVTMRKVQKSLQ